MLRVIEDAKTLRDCQKQLKQAVVAVATEHRKHKIGFPGGVAPATIYYCDSLDFWMAFESWGARYGNPCGLGYPFAVSTPAPNVEINFPTAGIDRSVGGVLLQDEEGVRYVGHTGKVGGGTKGVGQKTFLAYYPAASTAMSGKKEQPVYVLGRLEDPKLVKKVAAFTRTAKEFKEHVKAGTTAAANAKTPSDDAGDEPTTFSPEFVGKKTYTTSEQVEADCTHGIIVKSLRERLSAAGLKAGNTQSRDVYVRASSGEMTALFEVKTVADTTSVYTSIGQLYFHGGHPKTARLVAVLPDDASTGVRTRLAALGISLLTFTWLEDEPVFDGLDSIISALS